MPIVMKWLLPSSIVLFTVLRGRAASAAAQQQVEGSYVQQRKDTDVPPYNFTPKGAVNGELRQWHKVTIGFEGPPTNETHPTNPFTDYRLDVTFTHPATNKSYVVPGFYACDGNAANSGADAGPVWLTHFAPSAYGTWIWNASFVTGTNVAMNGGGTSASYMDGSSGSFEVDVTDKVGRDHRGKGLLEYIGEHHLRFAESGEYFLKSGADSPENFLSYEDFDNTVNLTGKLKTWTPHKRDAAAGDPTWAGGKGTGIIGAINYLSNEGMNSFSFLTLTIDGDDESIYPYISPNATDFLRMDCSKLSQWEVVFEHADRMGMFMHFKTQEEENDQLLNGGALGAERKLYYRELIARFSHHLALNWNLGEETTNTDSELKQFSDFFKEVDPYDHPVVAHTRTLKPQQEDVYLPLLGHPTFDGVSLHALLEVSFDEVLYWVQQSASAGRKWVVSFDEQAPNDGGVLPDVNDTEHNLIRKAALWGTIMAGGAGVEYYFGYKYPNSDVTLQDFRSRDLMWDQNRYALEFFSDNKIPFWNMTNANGRLLRKNSTNWCLAESTGDVLVVYLRDGLSDYIDLSDTDYLVQWFDPRNGGGLKLGTIQVLPPKQSQFLGEAPENPELDWVVLLRRCKDCTPDGEENTGLIVGLVVASLFFLAIAFYVVCRCHSDKNSKDSSGQVTPDFLSRNISRGHDPPALGTDSTNTTEANLSYHHPTILGHAIPLKEAEGPHFKDQVAPDLHDSESCLIATADARALGESTVEVETESITEFWI